MAAKLKSLSRWWRSRWAACIAWGDRFFTGAHWDRDPALWMLYAFTGAAVVRVIVGNSRPIQFESLGGHWVYHAWTLIGVTAPPLAGLAWWLRCKCQDWKKSSYWGMWLGFSADVLMFSVLLTFHLAGLICSQCAGLEETIFRRYLTAFAMTYVLLHVVRDVWQLVFNERVASSLQREGAA